ncbi:nuclear transport factor 2 family protein [Parachryseolinea silvisoli]|uniref:nuclear transport factor 2 family protein n=1 Tax=Parachryseolinea silvisoli TaxID=2873601 RepID=UPI002265A1DD|nr:nuclear transport factor 2 family protein [Parachryseolinea silvisoli]MCD9017173.1 nuclear transport factor 2 family protein [Parachryseolinea silvisoli]
MAEKNKATLLKGNAAIAAGNHEGFLSLCTDDTTWTFIGEQTLKGKEAVRQYMAITYLEPPSVTVDTLIAEGDFLTAVGNITMKDKDGKMTPYAYCDVWRFREGKMAELRAFVVKTDAP